MDENSLSAQEINIYCKYLTGQEIDGQCRALFQRAIQHEETVLNDNELRLLQFIIHYPFCIGFIDSALGLFHAKHRLRKRMIIAFAILETSPLYFNYFRPRVLHRGYLLTLIGKGVQEAVQALAGSIILLFY